MYCTTPVDKSTSSQFAAALRAAAICFAVCASLIFAVEANAFTSQCVNATTHPGASFGCTFDDELDDDYGPGAIVIYSLFGIGNVAQFENIDGATGQQIFGSSTGFPISANDLCAPFFGDCASGGITRINVEGTATAPCEGTCTDWLFPLRFYTIGDGVWQGTSPASHSEIMNSQPFDVEACDDGNTAAGDGCTAGAIDDGFTCTGEPSICSEDVIEPPPEPETVSSGDFALAAVTASAPFICIACFLWGARRKR